MTAFGALQAFREKSIPDQVPVFAALKGYRRLPIARRNDPEPLVDLRERGVAGENFYHANRNPPYWQRIEGAIPGLFAREGVARELAAINARLNAEDLELFVFDAFRPRAVQAYFHDVWMPRELKKRNPALAGEALTREIERYWAAPTADETSPAPHETGAAVDLTIRWRGGEPLWMGSLFDDASALSHRGRFETAHGEFAFSDEEARANRRLLHWLMSDAGFAAHPGEWWHFSLGDQFWAALTGAGEARYGLASLARMANGE